MNQIRIEMDSIPIHVQKLIRTFTSIPEELFQLFIENNYLTIASLIYKRYKIDIVNRISFTDTEYEKINLVVDTCDTTFLTRLIKSDYIMNYHKKLSIQEHPDEVKLFHNSLLYDRAFAVFLVHLFNRISSSTTDEESLFSTLPMEERYKLFEEVYDNLLSINSIIRFTDGKDRRLDIVLDNIQYDDLEFTIKCEVIKLVIIYHNIFSEDAKYELEVAIQDILNLSSAKNEPIILDLCSRLLDHIDDETKYEKL